MLKYSKITVCTGTIIQIIQDMYYGLNEGLGLGSLRLWGELVTKWLLFLFLTQNIFNQQTKK